MRYTTDRYTNITSITSEDTNYPKENMVNGSVLEQWRSTSTATQTITVELAGEEHYNIIALINCNAVDIDIVTWTDNPVNIVNLGDDATEPTIVNLGDDATEPTIVNLGGNAGYTINSSEPISTLSEYFYDYRYTTFASNMVRIVTITLSGGTNDGNSFYKIGELYISPLSSDVKTQDKAIQKKIIDNSNSTISSGNISIVDPSFWYRKFQISSSPNTRSNVDPLKLLGKGLSQTANLWVTGSSDSCYGDEILLGVLDSNTMQIEHIDQSSGQMIEKVVYGLREVFGGFENEV